MSKKTCLYNNNELHDDDRDFLGPCFYISPDVQLKEIPTTGEEYLLKVKKERQNCDTVTTCYKDVSKFAKNQSTFAQVLPGAKSAPDKLKPTIEWQQFQVADFSDVRMHLSRLLCRNTDKIKKVKIDANNPEEWKSFFEKEQPTLTYMLGMGQARLDKGLEYLIKTLRNIKPGQTIEYKTGQWIYAFLACTRQPLVSDTISILRDLLRRCADIRSHINEDDENALLAAAPLNLFICLVARYFGQQDLADLADNHKY